MTQRPFTNPILGIFARNSGEMTEHCFAALFDRTEDGHVADYRLISYIGTETPPDTGRSIEKCRTDAGMLLPISPTAARHLLAQLDTVREELTSDPKQQRYYYTPRTKLAHSLQAQKGRIPTNCVDFIMQSAQHAGIDVGTISDALRHADQVDDVTDAIDKRILNGHSQLLHVDAFLRGTTPMRYAAEEVDRGTQAVFFNSDENTDILAAVNALPRALLHAVSESKPLGQPRNAVERPHHGQTIAASTLANER